MEKKKIILVLLFAFIILLSLFVRFYDLTLDPFPSYQYGTYWGDEGFIVHNARNMFLFGNWSLEGDLYNSMFNYLPFVFLELLSFNIFGLSTLSMRLVPAVLGLLSYLIACSILFIRNKKEAIIFFTLLMGNLTLIAFSRTTHAEAIIMFFITITIVLIYLDTRVSWFFMGFLIPITFFSKITSLYFISAIGLAAIVYPLVYRGKENILKFLLFLIGIFTSNLILIPLLSKYLHGWYFMNFTSFGFRVAFKFSKLFSVTAYSLKFLLSNIFIFLIVCLYLINLFFLIKNKKKMSPLDLVLLFIFPFMFFQFISADFYLRRFLPLIPLMLLIVTKTLCNFTSINFSFLKTKISFNKNQIIAIFLIIYFMINFIPLIFYFKDAHIYGYSYSHNLLEKSKEISKYIPDESLVYGYHAVSLAVENKIKPYFSYNNIMYANKEEQMLPFFYDGRFNYAIMQYNLFDEVDLEKNDINLDDTKVYTYIKDNFEIIAVLNSKSYLTNEITDRIYIYRRIGFNPLEAVEVEKI